MGSPRMTVYIVDDNNDVLLNMGIIGRLTKIEKTNNNENGIASIYLTLVKCENEVPLQGMIETKRNEIKGAAPFVSLIKLMMMMVVLVILCVNLLFPLIFLLVTILLLLLYLNIY